MNRRQRRAQAELESIPPAPAGATNLHGLLAEALAHHQSGRLPEAERLYRRILQIDSRHPDSLHWLGVIARQVGRNDVAVDLIGKAVEIKGTEAAYHANLAIAQYELGRFDESVAAYAAAIRLKPDFAEAHFNLGNALLALGRLDDAVAAYRAALRVKPDYAEAHSNLGNALHASGRLDDAIAAYRAALRFNQGYAVTHSNLGNAWLALGRLDDALAAYDAALRIQPDHAETHNNRGVALMDQGKLLDAASAFRLALRYKPDFASAHRHLGNVMSDLGRADQAIECYRKAIQFRPDIACSYFTLHHVLIGAEDLRPATECLSRAVQIEPSNDDYRFFLGLALDYSGQRSAAAAHFARLASHAALARLEAWRYIQRAGRRVPVLTGTCLEAFKRGLEAATAPGLVLEFGVRFGTSIRQIAALANQEVHGFDSFEGLPEAWHNEPKGSYTTKGLRPAVADNVTLHAGWFSDTLPAFMERHKETVRFMNVDCDTYGSTKMIFDFLHDRIVPGTVIVFDEYIGNEHFREDELKAFTEATAEYRWSYEILSFSFTTKQVVVRILG